MKKRLLFAALFSAALVSCTKDQVVEVQQDEIKFRVATENATKASAVYCNSNYMSAFQVWAEYNDGTGWVTYFGDETINVSNTGVGSTNNTRYWPELSGNESINFYAVAGPATLTTNNVYNILQSDNSAWTGSGKAPIIKDFVVEKDVDKQEDLLYSVAKYEEQPDGDVAAMNFRHALSQIEFRAKNYNIEKNKLLFVLSRLLDCELCKNTKEDKIVDLMKKFDLFNEYFLDNVNKI